MIDVHTAMVVLDHVVEHDNGGVHIHRLQRVLQRVLQ